MQGYHQQVVIMQATTCKGRQVTAVHVALCVFGGHWPQLMELCKLATLQPPACNSQVCVWDFQSC
jgi:hypothetical protein